jgi:RimJ/RimL family protein N-acetyltransferase
MIISIYIRPLVLKDAQTSYLWRNDPQIWTYTGYKPNKIITPEIETDWLLDTLNKEDQCRFAICVTGLDTYIGNVQLLNIKDGTAEMHLFVGNKLYWGKGVGFQASIQVVEYGFLKKGLNRIYLKVHPANIPALSLYEKAGFEIAGRDNGFIFMDITRDKFFEKNHHVVNK